MKSIKISSLLLTLLSFSGFLYSMEPESNQFLKPENVFDIEGLDKSDKWLASRHILAHAIVNAFVKNNSQLISYMRRLEKVQPDSAELSYVKALVAYSRNDNVNAIIHLEESVEKEPTFDPAWNLLGYVLASANRHKEALAAFDIASRLNPYHTIYRYNHALSLRALERNSNALEQIDVAVKIKENFAEGHYLKALILIDMDRYEESAKSFEKARESGMDGEQFYEQYMTILEKTGDEKTLVELVEKTATLKSIPIKRIAARLYARSANFSKSMYLYSVILKSDEFSLEDQKQYIRTTHFAGRNPVLYIQRLKDQELQKKLFDYYEDVQSEEKPSPGPRDPIVDPGK